MYNNHKRVSEKNKGTKNYYIKQIKYYDIYF